MVKSGILEIGDIFVVNEADMEGADRLARDLRTMLNMGEHGAWIQPILKTQATAGTGIEQLWEEAERHRAHLKTAGQLAERRKARLRAEILDPVVHRVRRRLLGDVHGRYELEA